MVQLELSDHSAAGTEVRNTNQRHDDRRLDDEADCGCCEGVPPRTGWSTAANVGLYRILHPAFERDEHRGDEDQFDEDGNRGALDAPFQDDHCDAEHCSGEEKGSQYRTPAGAWVAQSAEISAQEQCGADGAAEERRKLEIPTPVEPVVRPVRFRLHAASLDPS